MNHKPGGITRAFKMIGLVLIGCFAGSAVFDAVVAIQNGTAILDALSVDLTAFLLPGVFFVLLTSILDKRG